jgi:TatD DNase family protein
MLIDAHAHLDHYDNPGEALRDIDERRIFTIANSMDPHSYERNLALAEKCSLVLPTFGIHPRRAAGHVDRLSEIQPLVDQSPMLGELGLDFHWVEDTETYPDQIKVFEFLVEAAASQGKAVNLHTKGAEARVLDTLVASGVEKAIIHWYSGPLDVLDRMIASGYLFTIGVEVLYSEKIREIARVIPTHQLLSETDNPGGNKWLVGEVALPRIVAHVVKTLAQLKGISSEKLEAAIQANFSRLVADDPRLATVGALLDSTNEVRR